MLERDNEEQLIYATSRGRALATANAAHFAFLHRHSLETGQTHAGIIIPQQRYVLGEVIRRLLRLARSRTNEDMCNRLEYLSSADFAGSDTEK